MSFLTQGNTNWKFIAIVSVLAIIVGGGIWFLSDLDQEKPITPEEDLTEHIEEKTADWQTYRNEGYGFEIKYYPLLMHWVSEDYAEAATNITFDGEYSYNIQILPKWSDDIYQITKDYFPKKEVSIENVELNSHPAFLVSSKNPPADYYVLLHDKFVYVFPTGTTGNNKLNNLISSTFRFVEISKEPNVILETNKTEYDYVYDEDFKEFYLEDFYAIIKNESDFSIWYDCMMNGYFPSLGLESYENGEWGKGSAVEFANEAGEWLGALGRSPSIAILNPNNKIDTETIYTFIPGYKYRLVLGPRRKFNCYSDPNPDCYLGAVYSNEFTIKEKPELIQEITGSFEFIDKNKLSDLSGSYIFKSNDGAAYRFIFADGKVIKERKEFLDKKVIIKGHTDSLRYGLYRCLEYVDNDFRDCIQEIEPEIIFIVDIKIE